jgi:hypothetical protein
MTRQVWVTAALALLLAPATACAESAEIEHRCTAKYPSISQYFAWKDCVKTATQQEAEENFKRQEENLKRQKKEAARPCLAADIPRMEGLATKARAEVKSELSLENAQAALSLIIARPGTITIPKDSIKDRVLVTSIDTICDAPFDFLINVREGPDKNLRWFRIWAEDAPAGYPAGLHQEFSSDFEAQREQERFRAEAAKRDEEFRASMAKQEQEREEQRQMLLRRVKISNVKMKCMGAGSCSARTLAFVVTNVSQQPIKGISFGWMLPSPQMTECPAKLATKEKSLLVLQPGEKAPQTIYIFNAPENSDARYCLSVTAVESPYPWER